MAKDDKQEPEQPQQPQVAWDMLVIQKIMEFMGKVQLAGTDVQNYNICMLALQQQAQKIQAPVPIVGLSEAGGQPH